MAILMRNGHPILSDVSKWDQLEEKPFDDLNKDFSVEPADPTNPSSRQVLHWGKEATWNEYNNPSYDKEGVHIVEMATPGVDTDYSAMEVSYDAEPDLTSATDPTLDNTTPAKMTGRDSLNTFFSKVSTAMGNLRWLFAHIGDLKQLTANNVGDGTLVGGIMKNYDRIQKVTASQYATMSKVPDTYYYVDEEEQNVLASNVINDNTTNNRGATVQAAINSLNNDFVNLNTIKQNNLSIKSFETGRGITHTNAVGIQTIAVNYTKTHSSIPVVLICWEDSSSVSQYWGFIHTSALSTTGFTAVSECKKIYAGTGNWYFRWIAIEF